MLTTWVCSVALAAVAPGVPSTADGVQVLRAAEVRDGSGGVFKPGAVVVDGGKIVAIGGAPAVPDGASEVDLGEAVITPGMIDAACQLGTDRLYGFAEQSSEVIPHLDVLDCVDFHDDAFETLAKEGVTTIFITPEACSVIGGRGCVVKTAGPLGARVIPVEGATIKATIGPESYRRGGFNRTPSNFRETTFFVRRPTTRMGSTWVFRKSFYDAMAFRDKGTTDADPAAMAALVDVLEGKTTLRFQARMGHDIMTSQRLADEFGIGSYVIEYGLESYKVLDHFADKKVPLIYGPIGENPGGATSRGGDSGRPAMNTAAQLAERGITFSLTAADLTGESGLGRQAGTAMRYGLSAEHALKAVTSVPAAMLGVDGRVGTLGAGKDADLVVWNGEPFADTSRPVMVMVGGEVVLDAASN